MIDQQIVKFIKKHHVLTLATVDGKGLPYVANCFYAYDAKRNRFIFTSDNTTLHATHMAQKSNVALSIVLETRVVGRVQGIQIRGIAEQGNEEDRAAYVKRFPYTALAPLNLWSVTPTMMKLTDNTLGFGKKLIWQSEE